MIEKGGVTKRYQIGRIRAVYLPILGRTVSLHRLFQF